MTEKGTCQKHGEFTLVDGCQGCSRDEARKSESISKDQEELEESLYAAELNQEGLTLEKDIPTDFTEPAVVTLTLIHPDKDALVASFRKQALGQLQYATDLKIVREEDLKLATEGLGVIAKLKKAVGDKQKEYLQPFKEHIAEVNEAFKKLLEPILAADTLTRSAMAIYYTEQERIRAEQEEVNRLRIEAAQREMKLKGELTEPVKVIEVIPEPAKSMQTDQGSAGMTDRWKYEVVDFALLPDDYKVVDSAMLTAIARHHHDRKEVPGVRFFNEPSITMRPR